MFAKILIANRGEVACRIARTCKRLGIAAATIHSSADGEARHVREIGESIEVGGAMAAQSYLDGAAILKAAAATGAEAIHPGIGFLSEDAGFARAVEAAGLVFIGPAPQTLEHYADKAMAKRQARAADVPVIDGGEHGSAEPTEIADQVRGMAPPVVLKAVAGGGGRGMRVLLGYDRLEAEIASAMGQAEKAFGRPDLLVEAFVDGARHVEVQIAGDGTGKVVHLFERECSLQRRHQKVIEEAPAASLSAALRNTLASAACRMAKRARFRGLGTVEFLVDGERHWFLEVNPRLQVEHPVTEMVSGLDLVEWQLRIAAGEGLPVKQRDISVTGHAIEARVYAEDVAAGFLPAVGVLRSLSLPSGSVRVDAGVLEGEAVTPHYDPLLAKIIAHGADRAQALAALTEALDETSILGLATNVAFLRSLLRSKDVIAGEIDIQWIDRNIDALVPRGPGDAGLVHAVAACLWLLGRRAGPASDPWTAPGFTAWRLGPGGPSPTRRPTVLVRIGEVEKGIAFSRIGKDGTIEAVVDGTPVIIGMVPQDDGRTLVSLGARVLVIEAALDRDTVYLGGALGDHTALVAPYPGARVGAGGAAGEVLVLAPVMGQIVKINVRVGDSVSAGAVLAIQESMKMELRITAPCDGVVARIGCAEGDLVERHALVAEVEPLKDAAE